MAWSDAARSAAAAARKRMHSQIRKDYRQLRKEWGQGLLQPKSGLCEVIRTTVSLNPKASVHDIRDALKGVGRPLNPHTVGIQYRHSRRIDAELNAMMRKKGR